MITKDTAKFSIGEVVNIDILTLGELFTMLTLNSITLKNGTNQFQKKLDQEKINLFITC